MMQPKKINDAYAQVGSKTVHFSITIGTTAYEYNPIDSTRKGPVIGITPATPTAPSNGGTSTSPAKAPFEMDCLLEIG